MTDVALKEYLERRLEDRIARVDSEMRAIRENTALALESASRSVDKAELALTRRLEAMNELRAQLGEQAATFARVDVITPRLTRLEEFQNRIVGALVVVPMVTSILVGLVVYFVTK